MKAGLSRSVACRGPVECLLSAFENNLRTLVLWLKGRLDRVDVDENVTEVGVSTNVERQVSWIAPAGRVQMLTHGVAEKGYELGWSWFRRSRMKTLAGKSYQRRVD